MNLIPAETYVDCLFGRTSQGSNLIDQAERDGRVKAIRQIQANALRYAASYQFLQGGHPYIKDRIFAAANQLDPQHPTP